MNISEVIEKVQQYVSDVQEPNDISVLSELRCSTFLTSILCTPSHDRS